MTELVVHEDNNDGKINGYFPTLSALPSLGGVRLPDFNDGSGRSSLRNARAAAWSLILFLVINASVLPVFIITNFCFMAESNDSGA